MLFFVNNYSNYYICQGALKLPLFSEYHLFLNPGTENDNLKCKSRLTFIYLFSI